MPIVEKTVRSVAEYVEVVTSFKANHQKMWFRGLSDAKYTLQPTIYRPPYGWEAERPLLHQFKARAARFILNMPNSDIEWLFIMQHHATPTRLLDWSENALVALAFAVQYRKDYHKDKDACVWCLNPIVLNSNIRFSDYDIEPIPNICDNDELQNMFESSRQKYPVAVIGPQNTGRIIAQRGVFTLFPNRDAFTMEELEKAETFLSKIIIPEKNIENMSRDLYYLGMTESTLFPELDSISKELRNTYERRK